MTKRLGRIEARNEDFERGVQQSLEHHYRERHAGQRHASRVNRQHLQHHYMNVLSLCTWDKLTGRLSESGLISRTHPRIREDFLEAFDQQNPREKESQQRRDLRMALQIGK